MAPPIDVCIRGAGIVGRTLALLLARERLHVGLVQSPQAPPGHGDVRAYALNAAAKELLERLRAWPDEAHATPVLGMEVHGDEGGAVHFSAAAEGQPALAWIADVPPLEARLAEALRYQPAVELLDQPRPAPLTVVCEGRASATRAEFGVQFDVTAYPQHAMAARFHCGKTHGQIARQWFGEGDILALLPLGGPGGNSVALVWSVPQGRVAELQALPSTAFEARVEQACGNALGKLTLASERAVWPLQLARADRWCGQAGSPGSLLPGVQSGWALAGDAAHNVHPLAGQGLNLGLADARALAQVLHEREYWRGLGDEKLLRRYERSRKAEVLAMGLATDGLQQLFAQPAGGWSWLRNWGMKGFEHSGPLKHWVARQAMGRL